MAGVVRCRNEVLARGFTQADNWVLFDKRISDGARVTYLRLRWYARNACSCWPGQVTLAKASGRSDRTIRAHLSELEGVGLITINQRGHCKTNEYWIEDLNDVYGCEENPKQPSTAALESCWPIGARLKEDPPEREPESDHPKPPVVEMQAAAQAIAAGATKAANAREKKLRKAVKAFAPKITRKVDLPEQEPEDEPEEPVPDGLKPRQIERKWHEVFTRKFHVMTATWGVKEFSLLKKLVENFGAELVVQVIEHVIEHWEEYVERFGLEGYPGIAFVWGYRATIFPEIQSGKRFDGGKRTAKAKINEAEYSEEDDDDLETPGW